MATDREKLIIDIIAKNARKTAKEIREVADATEDLEKAEKGVTKSIAAGKPHIRAMGIARRRDIRDTKSYIRELDSFNRMTQNARAEMLDYRDKMDKANRSTHRIRSTIRSTRKDMGAFGSVSHGVIDTFHGLANDVTKTRVSLGLFSLTLRSLVVGLGAAGGQIARNLGSALGLVYDLGSAAIGLGAAGAIGATAFAQSLGVISLASKDLADAWGGNDEALARLTPSQARFLSQLESMRPLLGKIREDAAAGLFPGVARGLGAAQPTIRASRPIVRGTGRALGGIAERAGTMLGSDEWRKDLTTFGQANIRIIGSLGDATLHFADALRDLLIPAIPLAEWLAKNIERGGQMVRIWAANSRASGATAKFFDRARNSLALIWSIARNFTGGILNLFGSRDVDGSKALRTIERLAVRWEQWTRSPAVRQGLGKAVEAQIPVIAGAIATAVAEGFVRGIMQGGKLIVEAFGEAGPAGKAAIALILGARLGAGGLLKKLPGLGGGKGPGKSGGVVNTIFGRAPTGTMTNPFFVVVLSGGQRDSVIDKAKRGGKTAAALELARRGAQALGRNAKTGLKVGGPVAIVGAADQVINRAAPGRRDRERRRHSPNPVVRPPADNVFDAAKDLIGSLFGGGGKGKSAPHRDVMAGMGGFRPVVSVQVQRREIARAVGEHVDRERQRR